MDMSTVQMNQMKLSVKVVPDHLDTLVFIVTEQYFHALIGEALNFLVIMLSRNIAVTQTHTHITCCPVNSTFLIY